MHDRPTYKYLGVEWSAVDAKPGDKPFCSMKAGAEVRFCGADRKHAFWQ